MTDYWQDYFDNIAASYDQESATGNIGAEVDFIVAKLSLQPGMSILDVGCGTGNHAIELARRGYAVTGVDISAAMLGVARRNSASAGVCVDYIQCPAQDFVSEKSFDAALSLHEGALCLFSDADDIWKKDMAILANMSQALKPGGRFMLTVLSAFAFLRSLSTEKATSEEIDLLTLTSRFGVELGSAGAKASSGGIKRYYTPPEIVRMVNRIGLRIDHFYGGVPGNWCFDQILPDEVEFMAIGTRKK